MREELFKKILAHEYQDHILCRVFGYLEKAEERGSEITASQILDKIEKEVDK